MRHRKLACFEALGLEPHFDSILRPLLCYFICLLRCNASRLLRMCWSSRGLPRLFLHLSMLRQKVKNAHRRQTFCAGSQQFDLVSVRLLVVSVCKQLVGFCSRFCCCLLSCSDIADVALGCVLVG